MKFKFVVEVDMDPLDDDPQNVAEVLMSLARSLQDRNPTLVDRDRCKTFGARLRNNRDDSVLVEAKVVTDDPNWVEEGEPKFVASQPADIKLGTASDGSKHMLPAGPDEVH